MKNWFWIGWVGLGLGWVKFVLDQIGEDWGALGWIVLNWVVLGRIGLEGIGFDCVALGWISLDD